VIKIQILLGHV